MAFSDNEALPSKSYNNGLNAVQAEEKLQLDGESIRLEMPDGDGTAVYPAALASATGIDGEDTMILVNLTPHPITLAHDGLLRDEPEVKIEIGGCDSPARVEKSHENVALLSRIPVNRESGSEVHGLPEPKDHVLFVVSSIVRSESDREDLVSPSEFIRDDDGRIQAATELVM
jgi:hypothetical protein